MGNKGLLATIAALSIIAALAASACAPAAPAPAPTTAPAAPAKAAEPTKAPEPTKAAAPAAPTKAPEPTKAAAAPAPKATWPEKGKPITMIVPFAAGGGTDMTARTVGVVLEKELGTTIQVVNKPGASTQVGLTELAAAKPDGYTLGMLSIPSGLVTYLDPSRKAPYTRTSFQPVALIDADPMAFHVKPDSKYKTLKDLVDDAKANPGKVKVGTQGIGAVAHLTGVAFEKVAGVKFSYVHFDGAAPAITALLGDNYDMLVVGIGGAWGSIKNGQIRQLGLIDTVESPLVPGLKTFESMGYKMAAAATYGIAAPAGTPKDVVDVLASAVKKAFADAEFKKKLAEIGMAERYMDAAAFEKYWIEMESWTKELLPLAAQSQ